MHYYHVDSVLLSTAFETSRQTLCPSTFAFWIDSVQVSVQIKAWFLIRPACLYFDLRHKGVARNCLPVHHILHLLYPLDVPSSAAALVGNEGLRCPDQIAWGAHGWTRLIAGLSHQSALPAVVAVLLSCPVPLKVQCLHSQHNKELCMAPVQARYQKSSVGAMHLKPLKQHLEGQWPRPWQGKVHAASPMIWAGCQ